MGAWKQGLKQARSLRPSRIRREAQRRFRVEVRAADEAGREALCRILIPDELSGHARARASEHLVMPGERAEVRVRHPDASGDGVVVEPEEPDAGLRELLRAHAPYRLALGRVFPRLRQILARDLIQAVAARNAAIAALSALPEVFPNPLSLLLALGEMGPETVLITANQVGLAFELAALQDEAVGWRAQSGRIGLVLAGALGWRTLARELVGLIPAGYGLAAKTGIAYSGSIAVGAALWRYQSPARVSEPVTGKFLRTQPATGKRQIA